MWKREKKEVKYPGSALRRLKICELKTSEKPKHPYSNVHKYKLLEKYVILKRNIEIH